MKRSGLESSLFFVLFIVLFVAIVLAAPSFHTTDTISTLQEDQTTLFTYNFSANVTNTNNETIAFEILNVSVSPDLGLGATSSNYPWFNLSSTTGLLTINATRNNQTGYFTLTVNVKNTSNSAGMSSLFFFNVTPVNDAPQFTNLENKSFNMSELFEYIVNVTDEENDIPFKLNITFLNCSVASWSTRDCSTSSGKELFNSTYYSFNTTSGVLNISFTPQRNDVGNYIINFTITDTNNTITPYNASRSQLVNFTVLNINSAPYFRYTCDNERNTTENSQFSCYINVTDIDEDSHVNITANETWFTFNTTGTNSANITINATFSYNGSILANFTPRDAQVGNWSINISLADITGTPRKANSTTFYFFIANQNDSVTFDSVTNLTIYSSNNYTFSFNATDDDLLIPDKSVYNETLTFSINNSNISLSTSYISGTNKTRVTLYIDPVNLSLGTNWVNLSVNDSNGYSRDSRVFNITLITNNPPVWNESTRTNHSLTEGSAFSYNLSANVTDPEGSPINFSYSNDTAFPSFSLSTTTGLISLTPVDADIGQHILIINATDGVTPTPLTFNFTVANINDAPNKTGSYCDGGFVCADANATINTTNSNVNSTEDSTIKLYFYVSDDDYKIPNNQKTFYNESMRIVNLTVTTSANATLLNFTESFDSSLAVNNGLTKFETQNLLLRKADVGFYQIYLNVSDLSNSSFELRFNLSINDTAHAPTMTSVGNQILSIFENMTLDINTTDTEDGNESAPGTNITYRLTNLTSGGNFLTINSTTGVINFSFNQTYAGLWQYNLSVNDTSGLIDFELFNVTVYDYPTILLPNSSFQFNLKENTTATLNFSVNHTVGDTLNYTLIIRGLTRNSTTGYGNASSFLWNFTANFTDETTCSGVVNITLNVSNSKLSNTTTWNLTVNHTDYPLSFVTNLGGGSQTITSTVIQLSDYFNDIDASDSCVNQTVGFTMTKLAGDTITFAVNNWTGRNPNVTFSPTVSATANYSLVAFEFNGSSYSDAILRNASSNNFTVQLSVTTVTTETQSSGGGGGGSTTTKVISLKIIVPEPVSAKKKDRIVVPIGIVNDGDIDLNEIVLDGLIAKNGILRGDLIASFDRSFIQSLPAGTRENITLIVDIDTSESGLFEVTINGSVKDPKYEDYGKFFIEIKEEEDIQERIVFTEEFIIGNPECAEFKEVLDYAKQLFDEGKIDEAGEKTTQALDACKQAIAQQPSSRPKIRFEEQIFTYLSVISGVAFLAGFLYYYYRRIKIKESFKAVSSVEGNI